MANKATRQLRKQISKAFAAGRTITSPPSKRSSKWKGVPSKRAGSVAS
jgi:hypothetical protein